jgi:Ca2+-binding EF-hand superfamily protein
MKTMKANRRLQNGFVKQSVRLKLLLVAPLLCLLGSCAVNKNLQPAQATPGTGEGGFELADANHDGKLSRAEASDFLVGEIFNAKDTNHDGRLTKEEWTAGDATASAEFKKRDANHDGMVTREEAMKYGRAHGMTKKTFREADKNHDGALDRAEVQAYYASREGPPR